VLQVRFIGVRKGEVQRPGFDASSFAHHGAMGAADAHLGLIAQNPYPFSFMLRSINVRIADDTLGTSAGFRKGDNSKVNFRCRNHSSDVLRVP